MDGARARDPTELFAILDPPNWRIVCSSKTSITRFLRLYNFKTVGRGVLWKRKEKNRFNGEERRQFWRTKKEAVKAFEIGHNFNYIQMLTLFSE